MAKTAERIIEFTYNQNGDVDTTKIIEALCAEIYVVLNNQAEPRINNI